MQPLEKHYFECMCDCSAHTIRVTLDPDNGEVFVSVHLNEYHSWYGRVWNALKYVFGYQSSFGAFDCTILKQEDYPKLRKLLRQSEKAHGLWQEGLLNRKGS